MAATTRVELHGRHRGSQARPGRPRAQRVDRDRGGVRQGRRPAAARPARPRAAGDRRSTCSGATRTTSPRSSAPTSLRSRRASRSARPRVRVLDRHAPAHSAARSAARSGWLGRAQRLVERDGRDCVERGYLLMPALFRHEAAGDIEGAPRRAARPRPRSASASATRDLFALAVHAQGHMLVEPAGSRRASAARRGDGRGHRRRALADRQRHRLLRRDRRLPGGLRAAPRAGVDRRAGALVRAPARHGRLHRPLPRAPRRDHAAARRLGGRARGGARARASAPRGAGNRRRAAEAAYHQGEVHRLRGELAAAEDAYREASARRLRAAAGARAAAAGAGRRRGRGGRRSAACSRDDGAARAGARCCPAYVEIMLAAGDVDEARARRATSSTRSRPSCASAMLARSPHRRAARSRSRTATPARRCAPLRARLAAWQELDAPYEAARARVLLGRRLPRARRRGRGRARARGGARGSSRSSARRRTSPASSALRRPRRRRARADRARARGAAPGRRRARRTGRSPPSSSSASGPSTATSATSSPSSASPRARPRPRTPTSTASSEPRWVKSPTPRAAHGWVLRPMRCAARLASYRPMTRIART